MLETELSKKETNPVDSTFSKSELSLSDTPRLIDIIIERKPKTVAQLRGILPESITSKLGEGNEGVEKTVSMLRNITTQIVFDSGGGEGSHLNEEDFAIGVASWIYFKEERSQKMNNISRKSIIERTLKIQQPMLRLALEGGILEEHESWAPPGHITDPYRFPISTHRLLRRIFKP